MRMRSRTIRSTIDGENGIILPTVLAMLLIALLLASVAATLAIQTKHLTSRDSSSKSAVEAANAGLRAAVYRLNAYQPSANYCPDQPQTAVGSGAPKPTLCAPDGPDVTQGLGNGATFSYWVSRAMQSGDTCTGPSVSNAVNGVVQRCITSIGTANGVSARVQERVAAYTSTPTFPTAIFGTKSVTIGNNVNIVSNVPATPALLGTNGVLTVGSRNGSGGGTTVIDGYQLPPGASLNLGANVTNNGPTTGINTPYGVPTPPYPYPSATDTASPYDNSQTVPQAGTCSQAEALTYGWSGTWTQTNCDYEIQQGITYPGCFHSGLPVKDCDVSSGQVTYDNAHHTLHLGNNSSLALGGGYYYFCSLYLGNNSQITVFGGQATIFIDSPNDPNTHCPNANNSFGDLPGTFTMSQNSTINAGGLALNAQILVYGDQTEVPPTNNVNLQNNGSSSFALAAPFSNVSMSPSNNSTFVGSIVGYTVTLGQASHFTYEADTKSFVTNVVPIYYPSYWEQCIAPVPGAPDPTSGC